MQDNKPSGGPVDVGHPQHPLRSPAITVRPAGSDVVLYDAGRGRLHVLNATAAAVWDCCDGLTNARDIALRVGDQFAGARLDRIETDIGEILTSFHQERLVIDSQLVETETIPRTEEA